MNLDKIAATLLLIGSDLPAFKALFAEVLSTFSEQDQDKLKASYAEAILASDKAHEAAQATSNGG